MANEIEKLLRQDLEDIARKTRIPLEYLKSILEKDFEALSDMNVKAYLKIIAREYELDLSGYLEEYEEFRAGNVNDESKIQINPKLTGYTAKETHNSFIWLIFVLIVLGIGVWAFKMVKDFDFDLLKPDFNTSTSSVGAKINQEENQSSIIITMPEQKEENITKIEEQKIDLDENITAQVEENSQIIIPEEILEENIQTALFSPKSNVWIGIKNLKDMSKNSFNKKEPFDVNLTGDRLIVTGHGLIDIQVGENNESFSTRDALRFHAYDGKLERIDFDEYVRLNKGKTW